LLHEESGYGANIALTPNIIISHPILDKNYAKIYMTGACRTLQVPANHAPAPADFAARQDRQSLPRQSRRTAMATPNP
jgi:hypothetical protein